MLSMKCIVGFITCWIFLGFISNSNSNSQWFKNLEEAQKLSEQTGRPILAYFTGSDWNDWCKKLNSEVFLNPGFRDWADKKVILLECDFPKGKLQDQAIKTQNEKLAVFFKIKEYPTICLFSVTRDKATKLVTIQPIGEKVGYLSGGTQNFIATIDEMMKDCLKQLEGK
jgi:thioredoxin-related protein